MIRHLGKIRLHIYSFLRVRTLGASLIPVDQNGKVLLVRNSYSPDMWRLPGGGLKRGESFPHAALREAREEVGLELDPSSPDTKFEMFGLYLYMIGHWQNHIALYVMKGWTRTPVKTWEVAETGLFDPQALPENTSPAHRRRIEEWFNGQEPSDRW